MGLFDKLNILKKKKRDKKIRLGLPEASTGKVIVLPPSETKDRGHGELHLRVPVKIWDSMGFDEYRRKARIMIKDTAQYEGITDAGMETFLAALIYEIVDQGYTGG